VALYTKEASVYLKGILFILLIIFPFSSYACKCEGLELNEAFENSKSVMLVEVTELSLKEVEDKRGVDVFKRKLIQANFNVIENFKSNEKVTVVVTSSGNCGIHLYPGQKFVLFVPNSSYFNNYVSTCTGSYGYRGELSFDDKRFKKLKEFVYNKAIK
jgi:hypothetical protein